MSTESNKPLVSVLIPVFNAAEYLPICLDSLLAQTYGNFEALMVDDGSVDNSLEVMKQYANSDCRFKVYTQNNSGPSAARNTALTKVKGEYIMKLDADDWVSADYIESAMRRIVETGSQGAVSDVYYYVNKEHCHRHTTRSIDFNKEVIDGLEGLVKSIIWEDVHSYLVLHKEIYGTLMYDTSGTFGDELTERRLISNCHFLAFSPGKYFYRQNPDSITKKVSVKFFDLGISLIQTVELLKEKCCYDRANLIINRRMYNTLRALLCYYKRNEHHLSISDRELAWFKMKELFCNIDSTALFDEYRKKGIFNLLFFKFKMSSWPAYKLVSWMLWPILKKNY